MVMEATEMLELEKPEWLSSLFNNLVKIGTFSLALGLGKKKVKLFYLNPPNQIPISQQLFFVIAKVIS